MALYKTIMSTVELKTLAKNMIDSLDLTDKRSMDMLVSVFKILSVFLRNDVQPKTEEKDYSEIKFKRRPLTQKVKDMSVKIDLPNNLDEKELYHQHILRHCED